MDHRIGTDEAEKIIKEYADMIYRIALHNVKNTADAEDIFQEVCISFITKVLLYVIRNTSNAGL